MTATTTTRTAQATPKISVTHVDRFHGVIGEVACQCANGHITQRAAASCIKSSAKPEKGTEVTFTTQPRFWGTSDGAQCACKFGHRSEAAARKCAGGKAAAKPAPAKAAPAKAAPAKAAAPKPAAPKALRSSTEGTAARA